MHELVVLVVRLKGGDPLVFGRGGEEACVLRQAGIPFEIVPGVTAGLGVTAYAGIPVTHREAASAVAFVTGHGDPESEPGHSRLDWSALAALSRVRSSSTWESLISRRFVARLIRTGKTGDTPAAVIESGTLPSQRTQVAHPGDHCSDRRSLVGLRPPALLVVGSVVELRDEPGMVRTSAALSVSAL